MINKIEKRYTVFIAVFLVLFLMCGCAPANAGEANRMGRYFCTEQGRHVIIVSGQSQTSMVRYHFHAFMIPDNEETARVMEGLQNGDVIEIKYVSFYTHEQMIYTAVYGVRKIDNGKEEDINTQCAAEIAVVEDSVDFDAIPAERKYWVIAEGY